MKQPWQWIWLGLLPFFSLASPWESLKRPSIDPAESVGSYANGCLIGAKALPLRGVGYQVLRSQNKRYYGHPATIEFIERFSHRARVELKTHVLIGDMSLPQGGRFSSGHSSHQTGLDIDIWYRLADTKLSDGQLKVPKPRTLVNMSKYQLMEKNWDSRHFNMVKMAAKDSDVARIFVHPVIKEKLCKTETRDRSWLRKVRPWWGHNYHMHVRLNCPKDDLNCVPQAPPPKGDGCGSEVASWKPKSNSGVKELRPKTDSKKKIEKPVKAKPKKVLPQQCSELLARSN